MAMNFLRKLLTYNQFSINIRGMYIQRILENKILDILKRGKSVLLLGPRQTGKTTLINRIPADKSFTLANPQYRLRYENAFCVNSRN
jgi:predicted AAA+ superfamily ATPase